MTDLIQFDAYIKKDNDVSRREFIMSEVMSYGIERVFDL